MHNHVEAVGIPWYRAEDFARLRALMRDGDKLHPTHALWQAAAEQLERKLRADGQRVVRAVIRPDKFAAWCAARGLDINAQGRTAYAAWVAKQADADGQN